MNYFFSAFFTRTEISLRERSYEKRSTKSLQLDYPPTQANPQTSLSSLKLQIAK